MKHLILRGLVFNITLLFASTEISIAQISFTSNTGRTAQRINSPAALSQSITVATNSTTNSLDAYLQSREANLRQTRVYTVAIAPAHGTLSGFPETVLVENGLASPVGLTYTPKAGYIGPDQFRIRITGPDGSSERVFNVDVRNDVMTTPVAVVYDFRVTRAEDKAVLNWSTRPTATIQRYELERSTNGNDYTIIHSVNVTANNVFEYVFTDKVPAAGTNYYRIRTVDRTGASQVYPVQAINFDENEVNTFRIYPNPVTTGVIQVQFNSQAGTYNVHLFNEQGQRLHSQFINHSGRRADYRINLPASVRNGVYNLVFEHENRRYTQKVVIQ
jgi:hypothetical protein